LARVKRKVVASELDLFRKTPQTESKGSSRFWTMSSIKACYQQKT
jgi:hypothetical protein